MSRPNHEPLSPEERALADRLARLGPHDGPPSALDAKILAAAHAAVARPRRRRWIGLTAIPGGLITGAGMAAALVVVVGVVWQLRPSGPAPQLPREEGDMGYISAEILKRAPPAPPPPPPPSEASARALEPPRELRPPALARRQPPPAAQTAAAPASDAHEHYLDEAIAPVHAPAPMAAPAAPAAPPAANATADAAVAAQVDQAREQARARQFSDDSAARQRAEATMAAKARALTVEPPSPALERIEATGSRVHSEESLLTPESLADVPIDQDADLDATAWLERIRQRRDTGDADGARASLKRFVETHPRVRLPRDLRELAKPATR